MAERLPWTLRAYRRLAAAAAPVAPMLLANRLKRGKEDAVRLSERRGESTIARPTGPLIWAHGASVVDENGKVTLDSPETRAAYKSFEKFGLR